MRISYRISMVGLVYEEGEVYIFVNIKQRKVVSLDSNLGGSDSDERQ